MKTLKTDSSDTFFQQLTNSWKFFSIGYLLPPSSYCIGSSFQPCLAATLCDSAAVCPVTASAGLKSACAPHLPGMAVLCGTVGQRAARHSTSSRCKRSTGHLPTNPTSCPEHIDWPNMFLCIKTV